LYTDILTSPDKYWSEEEYQAYQESQKEAETAENG